MTTPYVALHFGLVLVLALLALSLGRSDRRRELAHLAWVLVFVKLLVPPFIEIPVLAPAAAEAQPRLGTTAVRPSLLADGELFSLGAPDAEAAIHVVPSESTSLDARTVLLWLWATGAVLCTLRLLRSMLCFRRLLQSSSPPTPRLLAAADASAAALGLNASPTLRIVHARISPSLWPSPQATIVLPAGLVERLSPAELHHVILHEMAHFARRDHWVRMLEATVLIAYWWLPPVAWMRARLRAAEESCCDARVLRSGGEGAAYANALIVALEFLKGTPDRLPTLATSALTESSLSKRITKIMLEQPCRTASPVWRSLFAVGLLGLLPLLPARADAAPSAGTVWSPTSAMPMPAIPVPAPTPPRDDDEPAVSEDERQVLNKILDLISAGDRVAAAAAVQAARGPEASAVFDFTAGDLALQREQLEAAERDYDIAVAKHPAFRRAWRNLGQVRLQLGSMKKAAAAFRRTIELGGGDAVSYGCLANCLKETGELAGAESAYLFAIMLDPENLGWRKGLLGVLLEAGRYADAVTLTGQLIDEHPGSTELHLLHANAYIALNQLERATQALAALEELGGATTESRLMRGDLELNAGRHEQAVEAYLQAIAANPTVDPTRILRAAKVLARMGESGHAGALLDAIAPSMEAEEVLSSSGSEVTLLDAMVLSPPDSILIAVADDGAIVYGGQNIGLDGVRPLVERCLKKSSLPVVIQADRNASSGVLVRVVSEAKLGGASKLSISTFSKDAEVRAGLRTEVTRIRAQIAMVDSDRAALEQVVSRRGGESEPISGAADLDAKPRALYQPKPVLTARLRRKAPGNVTVLFVVDESGAVIDPRVEVSSDPAFAEPVLEAVKRWRFQPAVRDGKPVRFRMRMPVTVPGDPDPKKAKLR